VRRGRGKNSCDVAIRASRLRSSCMKLARFVYVAWPTLSFDRLRAQCGSALASASGSKGVTADSRHPDSDSAAIAAGQHRLTLIMGRFEAFVAVALLALARRFKSRFDAPFGLPTAARRGRSRSSHAPHRRALFPSRCPAGNDATNQNHVGRAPFRGGTARGVSADLQLAHFGGCSTRQPAQTMVPPGPVSHSSGA
jgi:hypothetical protein